MSDKKYPADTPVTLELLAEILKDLLPSTSEMIEDMIEPTKPEPNDGELWLCYIKSSADRVALWKFVDGWRVYKSSNCMPFGYFEIEPLRRLLPAEDEA